jgi:hypothetical protein
MRVLSTKPYGWHDVLGARVGHGRLYGAQRSKTWSIGQRVVAAALCAGLPLLAYCRLTRRIRRVPTLRRMTLRIAPLVFLSLVLWSVGEAQGYLRGARPGPGEVF